MALINLLVLLALVQFLFFGTSVGRARARYGVAAPATTGNEHFERYLRVQMNTLELLILLIPCVWIATTYSNRWFVAAMLAVYLIGRTLYYLAYVHDPKKREMGFLLSIAPIIALLIAGLIGAVWSLVQTGIH